MRFVFDQLDRAPVWFDRLTVAAAWFDDDLLGEVNEPGPAISTLVDDFSTTTGLWNLSGGAAVSAGVLSLAPTIPPGDYYPPALATSVTTYDLTGSEIVVEIATFPALATVENWLTVRLSLDANNFVDFFLYASNSARSISARKNVAGTVTSLSSSALSETDHRWLRIAESGGTIDWYTSPDGSTWTVQGAGLASSTFDITNLSVLIEVSGERTPTPMALAQVGADAGAPATASGSLSLGGSVAARAPIAAAGSITLAATATARAATSAAGSITITGAGIARVAATAAGSVSLAGGATWVAPPASGAITLAGSATGRAPIAAAGAITLAASGTAQAPIAAAGSVTLAGAASATTGPSGSTAAGSITLDGSALARAAATAAGSITLDATSTARAAGSASGAITLAASSTARAAVTASGAIVLTATSSASAAAFAAGSVTLAGSALARAAAFASGTITLAGAALAVSGMAPPGGRVDALLVNGSHATGTNPERLTRAISVVRFGPSSSQLPATTKGASV